MLKRDAFPARPMDLVLRGHVVLHADGTATVTAGAHTYAILDEACACEASAPCPHVLAIQLLQRTAARLHMPSNGQKPAQQPTPPQPDGWQSSQAPSSCTLKWSSGGIELLLTLRDSTDEALYERLKRVLPKIEARMEAQRQAQEHAQATGQPTAADWCPVHQVPLKRYTKDGRAWYSHRTADGWCRGQ